MAVDYDAAGNVVSATDPEGRTTTYTYTADGQPLTKTGPSGTVTTHTYDPTSGLLSGVTVTAPGQPTRTITYTRVPAGQPGAGQVETVSDGTDTITYGYDADGHRTSVTYPDGTSTSADYNDKGQLATTTDVTGAVTTYVYDPADGTLTSATQRRGSTVLASVTYTYDAMSRIATTTRGNGTVTTNTYTAQNQLATQTTTNAGGQVLEAHSYTYDAHYNPATRTDTYAPGGSAIDRPAGTWTTVYSYDAYDRLIGSAVYAGPLTNGQPTGLPVTTTRLHRRPRRRRRRHHQDHPARRDPSDHDHDDEHEHDRRLRPADRPADRSHHGDPDLRRRRTGAHLAGRRHHDLHDRRVTGDARRCPTATTTTYTLWPDGTRRSATTTDPDGRPSTVTYHYGVDGVLVNDSTSDTSTAAGTATTASYLVTAGREARTLLAGTASSGKVTGTPAAPIDTGTGVGYYLRDRHTSVTGLVDDTGTVTATYAYTDYGAPARADGRPVNLGTFDGGRTNPYTYLGASPRGPSTEAAQRTARLRRPHLRPPPGPVHQPRPRRRPQPLPGASTPTRSPTSTSPARCRPPTSSSKPCSRSCMLATAVLTAGAAARRGRGDRRRRRGRRGGHRRRGRQRRRQRRRHRRQRSPPDVTGAVLTVNDTDRRRPAARAS